MSRAVPLTPIVSSVRGHLSELVHTREVTILYLASVNPRCTPGGVGVITAGPTTMQAGVCQTTPHPMVTGMEVEAGLLSQMGRFSHARRVFNPGRISGGA